jgi:hypothetical protein
MRIIPPVKMCRFSLLSNGYPYSFPECEFFKTGYLLNVTYSVKNGPLAVNQMFFASDGMKIRIQYSLIKIFDYQGNEKDF